VKVARFPENLVRFCEVLPKPERIGLETGTLSYWLFCRLAAAELPVVCAEYATHRAMLQARINKNDRNDAPGIAQMMRVNPSRPVHVKTLAGSC
jgi:transposase